MDAVMDAVIVMDAVMDALQIPNFLRFLRPVDVWIRIVVPSVRLENLSTQDSIGLRDDETDEWAMSRRWRRTMSRR
jgi:hypothetical protein